jgi:hypothetical protein
MNEWMESVNLLTYNQHPLESSSWHMQFWHEVLRQLHIHASIYTERKISVHAWLNEWMNRWMNELCVSHHDGMIWM